MTCGLRNDKALADGHVTGVEHVHVVAALGGGAGGLVGARGHGRVGDVEDLGVRVLGVDAVEDHGEIARGAAARAREHAELAALLEHLGGRELAVIDSLLADGDVHGHDLDAELGRLGGRDVGAGLGNDDDFTHDICLSAQVMYCFELWSKILVNASMQSYDRLLFKTQSSQASLSSVHKSKAQFLSTK